MIRLLNITFIAFTGFVCLSLYHVAEEARVAAADLRATRAAIATENDTLVVLGAEWARVTQPKRIQALVDRHLKLSTRPNIQLSSLSALPRKNPPLVPAGSSRNANAVVPSSGRPPFVPTPVHAPRNPPPFPAIKRGT